MSILDRIAQYLSLIHILYIYLFMDQSILSTPPIHLLYLEIQYGWETLTCCFSALRHRFTFCMDSRPSEFDNIFMILLSFQVTEKIIFSSANLKSYVPLSLFHFISSPFIGQLFISYVVQFQLHTFLPFKVFIKS